MFLCVDLVTSIHLGQLFAVSQYAMLTGVPDFTCDVCSFCWFSSEESLQIYAKDLKEKFPSLLLVGLDYEIVNKILEV